MSFPKVSFNKKRRNFHSEKFFNTNEFLMSKQNLGQIFLSYLVKQSKKVFKIVIKFKANI